MSSFGLKPRFLGYQPTFDAVLAILRLMKPADRAAEKALLFGYRYGAGCDHRAVEDALAAYHEEVGR